MLDSVILYLLFKLGVDFYFGLFWNKYYCIIYFSFSPSPSSLDLILKLRLRFLDFFNSKTVHFLKFGFLVVRFHKWIPFLTLHILNL